MPKNISISSPDTGIDEWEACKEPILNGWLTQGSKVREFENKFADLHQVEHAIATTSCTTALHLILAALGIKEGDEVIVPAFTWVATANAVLYVGATPVLVDIDLKTFNLDPSKVKEKISSRTKAIIVVHLFGLCAPMDELNKILPKEIYIIEDAACAAGAEYEGVFAGSLGIAGAFSFHPRKSITTGEGGMITTNKNWLADKLNILRNHGASISGEQRHIGPQPYLLPAFDELGFNFRMTDIQGAIGLVQLSKLESYIDIRRHWASYYESELKSIPWIQCPEVPAYAKHAWQAYVTIVDQSVDRNKIMASLQESGISTRPGTHAVHSLGYYKSRFGFTEQDFPNSFFCNEHSMAIPLHNRMTEEDFEYVVKTLRELI